MLYTQCINSGREESLDVTNYYADVWGPGAVAPVVRFIGGRELFERTLLFEKYSRV